MLGGVKMNCKECIWCGKITDKGMFCERTKWDITNDEFTSKCQFYSELTEIEPMPENYIPPKTEVPNTNVAKIEEIETVSTGGKQAKEPYDYSLIPKEALHLVTLNMTAGAEKYGEGNYLSIPVEMNAGRAVVHLQMACMTDEERVKFSKEDRLRHLINGVTRALFALDCELRGVK